MTNWVRTSVTGVQVYKKSDKPFKSGNRVNTVKGVTINEQTGRIAFTFEEDDSDVEIGRCNLYGS